MNENNNIVHRRCLVDNYSIYNSVQNYGEQNFGRRIPKNFDDYFDIVNDNIGIGAFSVVMKARHKLSRKFVAVKKFIGP